MAHQGVCSFLSFHFKINLSLEQKSSSIAAWPLVLSECGIRYFRPRVLLKRNLQKVYNPATGCADPQLRKNDKTPSTCKIQTEWVPWLQNPVPYSNAGFQIRNALDSVVLLNE